MDFILYNKHQPLCAVILNTDGTIKKITEVYNEAYAPLGVNLHDRLSLYEWWKGRSIPGSRDGLSKFLSSFKISSSTLLPLKSFALSLSDQYWLKPAGAAAHAEKAAFFKQLQLNTEPVFVYYRALAGAEAKRKYNPELDKKIFQLLLQDGFSLEQCKKILLNSPNLKNHRMVDLFIKNCC